MRCQLSGSAQQGTAKVCFGDAAEFCIANVHLLTPGSIAAGLQSLIYGAAVPVGSLFATATSLGATGSTTASITLAAGPMGAIAAGMVLPRVMRYYVRVANVSHTRFRSAIFPSAHKQITERCLFHIYSEPSLFYSQ